jgi:hypothetical protein
MDPIDKLNSFNLSEVTPKEIWEELHKIGKVGKIISYIYPGESLLRGRSLNEGEEFLCKSDYTYPPSRFSKKVQRASHPGLIMFYGTYVPQMLIDEGNDLRAARVTGILEARSDLRSNNTNCVQKIAFGRWVCKEKLKLVGVFQSQSISHSNNYIKDVYSKYLKFLDKSPEFKPQSIRATNFLAEQFSKENIDSESDYLISALYTEMAVKNGFDGVLFPSVQTGGFGINCAITPFATDNKLDFVYAGECIVYKRKTNYIVDNLRGAEMYKNQTHFEMKDLDPGIHAGEEACLKKLGLNSMQELLDNK